MPTIPSVADMGARPTPESNRQLAVVQNPGAIGDALAGIGRAAQQAGDQLQQMHNEDSARRLDIAHAEAARKIRMEATQAQGMDAAPARATAEQQMDALNADILSRAPNHAVRDALTPLVSRRANVEMDSIGDHALHETTSAMEGAMTARRDMAIQGAEEHYDNPQAVEDGINTARTEIANHGQWRGLGQDQVHAEQFMAGSQVRSAVVERIAGTGNYQGALDYLNTHSGEIDGAREQALRTMLHGPLTDDAAEHIVDNLPAITGQAPGVRSPPPLQPVTPGNIDLSQRPAVHNPDGSVSTIRSISIGTDQGEVLIPTVVNGRVVPDADAVAHYRQTGENLGTFHNAADADRYAVWLHDQEAHRVGADGTTAPPSGAPPTAPTASPRSQPLNEGNQPARFQVDGWTVGDGYGANRGDHVHHGVDIFAAAGTPFPVGRPFDIVESHRQTSHGGIGGNVAVVQFHDGSQWIAAHLPNLPAAGHYEAGAPVLEAGNSGSAAGGAAHVHWQPANTIAQAIYNQGRHEVAAYLTGTSTGSASASAGATVPTGQRIDYTAARSQIEALNLPSDLHRAAVTALERRITVEDGIRTRAGQDAETAITQQLVQIQAGGGHLTSMSQLDPSLVARVTQFAPHMIVSLQSMIEANNHPTPPPANSPLANQLIVMAADDPNGFLRINPELLRGRITDEEVQGIVRTQTEISHRTGPQPGQIMSVIRMAVPPDSPLRMAGAARVAGAATTQGERSRTQSQAQALANQNLEARLLPAVQTRLRALGHAVITQQDIMNAVQAETMMVHGADGTLAPIFLQREQGATHYQVTVPPRAIGMIDEALRRGGQLVTDNNRAQLYIAHRAEIDAAAR